LILEFETKSRSGANVAHPGRYMQKARKLF